VYIIVCDTKDIKNISFPKELMYSIVLKYVAFSVLYVIKQKLILLKEIDDNNKHF